MSQQDQMLKAYLERVIALREQKNNALSEKDLRDIAGEIGLSDEDLLAADRAAQDHFIRGENYLKHGRLDDAIREIQDAVALAPGWLAYKSVLAQAFFERWRKLNREPDRHAAAQLARECIAIDADHAAAYQLLNQLDGPPRAGGGQRSTAAPVAVAAAATGGGALIVGLAVAGISVLICGGGMLSFLLFSTNAPAPVESYSESYTELSPESSSEIPVAPALNAPSSFVPVTTGNQGVEIPLNVEFGGSEALEVAGTPVSKLKVYGDKPEGFYEGQLLFTNKSAQEVLKPKLRLTLFGEGDDVLAVKDVYPTSFAPESYRPGDSIPVRLLHKVPSTVQRAALTLTSVETKPAAKAYAESKVLKVVWAVPSQQDDRLIVKEREANFRTYKTNPTDGYFVPELELHNTSDQEIERFKVSVLMYDAANKMILSEPLSMVSGSVVAVGPGEVRVVRRTFKVPAQFKSYTLEVTEVKFK